MADSTIVRPDLNFIKEVKALGGDSLKKCFQCATCSVVCKLTPEDKPFPRKEMIWAQWGLKDKLMKDPDIWLCYNCNDCSVNCPRDAKPGEVLAAVRNYSFINFAFPRLMGKVLSQARYLPLLFGFPLILLLLILQGKTTPSVPILFRNLIPYELIDVAAGIFTLLVLIGLITGVSRFWSLLTQGITGAPSLLGALKSYLMPVVSKILRHEKFNDCEANKIRYYAHLAIFYGFVLCLIATSISAGGIWAEKLFFKGNEFFLPPWSLFSVVKLAGNLGGIAIVAGCLLVLYNRSVNKDKAGASTYLDSVFTWTILFVVITGFLTQFARMAEAAFWAYLFYGIHLVFVFYLLAYLPYSMFAHMIYRTVAMIFAEYSDRKK
jgi:quinone-modifying oxidoreductase subunit QmoC